MHDVSVGLGIAITPDERLFCPDSLRTGTRICTARSCRGMAGSGPKLFHDAKYARHVLANMQMPVGEQAHDTMLMSYVNEAHLKHDMQKLAARYLSMATANEDDFLGKGAARTKVANMPVGQTARSSDNASGFESSDRGSVAVTPDHGHTAWTHLCGLGT